MGTVTEVLREAVAMLKGSSDTPILDAELIFIEVFQRFGGSIDKIKIITNGGLVVDNEITKEFLSEIQKRKMGTPVQYITQKQEFMGLELFVRPGVLIPRPDTEIIVEEAINALKEKGELRIIDMCTGSGAIAVSLAYYMKDSYIYAVDISDTAIECGRKNIESHGLGDRIELIKSDLFSSLSSDNHKMLDAIVSNPPYIPSADIEELETNVKDYEPRLALDGGEDGLSFYRQIIASSRQHLKPDGMLFLEIGYNQGEAVKSILKENKYTNIKITKDLAGLDRCVQASNTRD